MSARAVAAARRDRVDRTRPSPAIAPASVSARRAAAAGARPRGRARAATPRRRTAATGTACWATIGPPSSVSSTMWTVTPVTRAPPASASRTACAPGKAGSRLGWTFRIRAGKCVQRRAAPSTRMKPARTTRSTRRLGQRIGHRRVPGCPVGVTIRSDQRGRNALVGGEASALHGRSASTSTIEPPSRPRFSSRRSARRFVPSPETRTAIVPLTPRRSACRRARRAVRTSPIRHASISCAASRSIAGSTAACFEDDRKADAAVEGRAHLRAADARQRGRSCRRSSGCAPRRWLEHERRGRRRPRAGGCAARPPPVMWARPPDRSPWTRSMPSRARIAGVYSRVGVSSVSPYVWPPSADVRRVGSSPDRSACGPASSRSHAGPSWPAR